MVREFRSRSKSTTHPAHSTIRIKSYRSSALFVLCVRRYTPKPPFKLLSIFKTAGKTPKAPSNRDDPRRGYEVVLGGNQKTASVLFYRHTKDAKEKYKRKDCDETGTIWKFITHSGCIKIAFLFGSRWLKSWKFLTMWWRWLRLISICFLKICIPG